MSLATTEITCPMETNFDTNHYDVLLSHILKAYIASQLSLTQSTSQQIQDKSSEKQAPLSGSFLRFIPFSSSIASLALTATSTAATKSRFLLLSSSHASTSPSKILTSLTYNEREEVHRIVQSAIDEIEKEAYYDGKILAPIWDFTLRETFFGKGRGLKNGECNDQCVRDIVLKPEDHFREGAEVILSGHCSCGKEKEVVLVISPGRADVTEFKGITSERNENDSENKTKAGPALN